MPFLRWIVFGFVALLLLVVADQPRASRVLLLDLAMTDPLLLEQTAAPWRAAGYRVTYRRYYPHVTRRDLERYRTIVVLGGAEPARLSGALRLGDLALLTEHTQRRGVVVLGYDAASQGAAAAGALDRWSMNRWLGALGTGIRIGERSLADTGRGARTRDRDALPPVLPQPRSALDNAGFAAFAGGRTHPLTVQDPGQALARAASSAGAASRSGAPVVAASRIGHGLVVVTSRQTLAAGHQPGAATFLAALARWTRRPAEWASVAGAVSAGPVRSIAPLSLRGAPGHVAVTAPLLAPPAHSDATELPQRLPLVPPPTPPAWISRQGMRVLWADFTGLSWPRPSVIDSILRFTDAAALNALATEVPASALADSVAAVSLRGLPRAPRTPWQLATEQLGATSLRWFPAIALSTLAFDGPEEVDLRGELAGLPCALDSTYWRGVLRPAFRALTRLGGARREVVTGIAIALDPPAARYSALGFCDADYRIGVAALRVDSTRREQLLALPPVARRDTLLQQGLLGDYYAALEAAVRDRAATLLAELRRLHPDLRFAFRAARPPTDWFSLGLLRGFSSHELPVFLWLEEPHDRQLLARYRAREITALGALQLDPARIPAAEWSRLAPVAFVQHHGFWLAEAAADTVGRVIRRLVK